MSAVTACAQSTILQNPTDHAVAHALVRIGSEPQASPFVVQMDGSEVPYQVMDKEVWVDEDFKALSSHHFSFAPGKPVNAKQRVAITVDDAAHTTTLDNGIIAIRLPAEGSNDLRAPVSAIKIPGGEWLGESFWKTDSKLKSFKSTIIADGTSFARVRLQYVFDSGSAEAEITLEPGANRAEILEKHSMSAADNWEFDCCKGWSARQGISIRFNEGILADDDKKLVKQSNRALLPGGLPFCAEEMFISLMPRWNQQYRDGWFFAATDGTLQVGALPIRTSQWIWPIENKIDVIVKPSGQYAGLRCPTQRGQRLWWLFASPSATAPGVNEVRDYAWQNLDKLNQHYILDWPGVTTGAFPDINWFDDTLINPTHKVRQQGKAAVKAAGNTGDLTTLYTAQQMLDPDTYGSYWTYQSPENPNFFTDFNRVPIALAAQLRTHPAFEILRKFAEQRYKEDVFNSVTLPGGAGQECPGYLAHALETWDFTVPLCRQYLGFDPSSWDRYKAAKYFLKRISQPSGNHRMELPIGDTHPGPNGPKPVTVNAAEVAKFKTEELPGFGVIFNNRPGTPQETYLAFKAGPNRGHYHGDQLAFHFCADATPIAVFHHSSYNPRPGQEHMCNRVAFSTDQLPYANIDGYERLIAFKTSDFADIAVGQVESNRLRKVEKLPPEKWDEDYPRIDLDGTLKYRRTIVFMKNGPRDYIVIRDQFTSPIELNATFCLHVLANSMHIIGNRVEWPNLTLYCVTPDKFDVAEFPWSHANGGKESTQGVRLTQHEKTGEFITVVYPGKGASVTSIKGGVKVGDDEIIFQGGWEDAAVAAPVGALSVVEVHRGNQQLLLDASEINLDRSQGEVGLFVPDAGYPFGPIPDWLISQRAKLPPWAMVWWK